MCVRLIPSTSAACAVRCPLGGRSHTTLSSRMPHTHTSPYYALPGSGCPGTATGRPAASQRTHCPCQHPCPAAAAAQARAAGTKHTHARGVVAGSNTRNDNSNRNMFGESASWPAHYRPNVCAHRQPAAATRHSCAHLLCEVCQLQAARQPALGATGHPRHLRGVAALADLWRARGGREQHSRCMFSDGCRLQGRLACASRGHTHLPHTALPQVLPSYLALRPSRPPFRLTCRCARGPVGATGPGLSSRMPSKRRSGGGRDSADEPAAPLPRYLR